MNLGRGTAQHAGPAHRTGVLHWPSQSARETLTSQFAVTQK